VRVRLTMEVIIPETAVGRGLKTHDRLHGFTMPSATWALSNWAVRLQVEGAQTPNLAVFDFVPLIVAVC
jgi:hypothetical protein